MYLNQLRFLPSEIDYCILSKSRIYYLLRNTFSGVKEKVIFKEISVSFSIGKNVMYGIYFNFYKI